MKTLSTSLSKRLHLFDKYVDHPVRTSKIFDLNAKIDRTVSISDYNIAQAFFELISNLFESLYKLGESFGMDFSKPDIAVPSEKDFTSILTEYSETFLMCYDLIGSNIMGDYYLNNRNTNIQKMIKLALYYGLEDLSSKIIALIAKECLFQSRLV